MAPDVRKPPIGAVIRQHKQGVRGSCGWCGLPVAEKTEVRGWLKFWHDACSVEMAIIEQPAMARHYVFKRDQGVCCDCGEDWSQHFRLVPDMYVSPWGAERADTSPENYTSGPDGKRLVRLSGNTDAPYVSLTAISLWHVDHKVPLWKARHMPDLQRLEYFKLANLVTRCHRCHGFKTKKEAGARAKFNDQGAPAAEPKRKQKFQSRGFQQRPPGAGNGFPPRGSTPMKRK